jgi:hypothetical protein
MYFSNKYVNSDYNYIAECIQSLHIVQIIYIAIQLIYLNIFFGGKTIPIFNQDFDETTTVSLDTTKIYLTEYTRQTKLILFVSGLYNQDYTCYMEKMYYDLNKSDNIREKYMFMIYNNNKLTNFDVAAPISRCLEKIVEKYNLDEIIIVGFSAGGVVASHIMSKLKHIKIEKKIVTYDCPFDIYYTLHRHFHSYCRLDIFFYLIVLCFYETNWGVILKDTAKNCILKIGDEPAVFALTEKIHNMSREDLVYISQINMDQDENTRLFFINCVGDPVFQLETRNRIADAVGKILKYPPKIYEKWRIGHCSDMAFNADYIIQLREIVGE